MIFEIILTNLVAFLTALSVIISKYSDYPGKNKIEVSEFMRNHMYDHEIMVLDIWAWSTMLSIPGAIIYWGFFT